MAKAYPEAKVLGVDIASNSLNPALLPPNLRYEIHDINKGLRKYYNKFDVVQVRCVLFAIHDFKKALKNIQLCVKPGGLVIHIEADIDYRVEDRIHSMKIADPTKEGPDTDGSWIKKVSWGMCIVICMLDWV
jgi:ubiquinone/menaquinone biosynthesis C-methylase UbiE